MSSRVKPTVDELVDPAGRFYKKAVNVSVESKVFGMGLLLMSSERTVFLGMVKERLVNLELEDSKLYILCVCVLVFVCVSHVCSRAYVCTLGFSFVYSNNSRDVPGHMLKENGKNNARYALTLYDKISCPSNGCQNG